LLLAQAVATPTRGAAVGLSSRKITFVVGFAPGGGIDTFARVMAQELTEQFGWQIVIENRAGAASNIAAKLVAAAAPDGYTLLFTGNSYAINQTLYRNPGYATRNLAPVAFVALDSQALAVHANNQARTLPEFFAAGAVQAVQFRLRWVIARIAAEYVFHVLAKANATGVPFQTALQRSTLCSAITSTSTSGRSPRCTDDPAGHGARPRRHRPAAGRGPARCSDARRARFPGLGINGWIGLLAAGKNAARDPGQVQCGGEPDHRHAEGRAAPARPGIRALSRDHSRGRPLSSVAKIETWGN